MPAKKPAKKERQFNGFVNCELDKETKELAKAWIKSQKDFDSIMERLLDGYKLSISQDLYNDCYQASLTCTAEDNPNTGWCLVGRGPSYLAAIGMVAYKHLIVLEGQWGESEKRGGRDEWG